MESRKELPYGRQSISDEDIAEVVRVLKSPSLTQGPEVLKFEQALAEACGARYAVAVNSGTAALHIAYLAAEFGAGDEIISSPITFVASTNAAFYTGATPVFADVEADTILLDPKAVAKKITAKTRAIVPVNFAGQCADLTELKALATDAEKKFGKKVYLIDDACHALGGTYAGSPVGSCKIADMTCLSFHPVKHITTGEGGAVTTNDERLYQKLLMFRSHGITRDVNLLEDPSQLPWGYEQHVLGYNYRLTDIQSVLGHSQLRRLPAFIRRRREIAAMYDDAFSQMDGIRPLLTKAGRENAFHLYVVRIDFNRLGGRAKVMQKLREEGLITQVHYIPVHTQPYYKKHLGTKRGDFPVSEAYYEQCLSIPMYPALTDEDVARVIRIFKNLVA